MVTALYVMISTMLMRRVGNVSKKSAQLTNIWKKMEDAGIANHIHDKILIPPETDLFH